jgi:putative ABC transport system permease protein
MLIVSIAWKNVWRNRKRSLIVIIAVLLGTAAGVFTSGLMVGWVKQRSHSLVYTETGHIKIHHPDFLKNEELNLIVPHATDLSAFLGQQPAVKASSERLKCMVMAATSRGTTGMTLQGVDPAKEMAVSDLHTHLIPNTGGYLDSKTPGSILISDRTAELLKIKTYVLTEEKRVQLNQNGVPTSVTDKLTDLDNVRYHTEKRYQRILSERLTAEEIRKYGSVLSNEAIQYRLRSKIICTLSGMDGNLVSQSFKVGGIYKTTNAVFDLTTAYVLKSDLAPLTGLTINDCHEIGLILNDEEAMKPLQDAIRNHFPTVSVQNWLEISPEAGILSEYMDFFYYILMGFILFALAFGILNTMLMAVLERTKELGMLMAIGMSRKRIFTMIMLESIFLTLTGSIFGMGVGWVIITITGQTGLDFSVIGEGFEAMGWSAVIYPSITPDFFLGVTLLVVLTGLLAAIIPARRALALIPVEALKTDN